MKELSTEYPPSTRPRRKPWRDPKLARKKVTTRPAGRTVPGVAKVTWPWRDFRAFVEERMKLAGIDRPAELARRMDVTDALISKWLNGKSQPSKQSLRKMAEALNVPLLALELKAGHVEPEDLDAPPDTTAILPPQIERVIDAYMKATQRRPDLTAGLLERIDYAAEWFEVAAKSQPSKK